jgi:hypothetical protein
MHSGETFRSVAVGYWPKALALASADASVIENWHNQETSHHLQAEAASKVIALAMIQAYQRIVSPQD